MLSSLLEIPIQGHVLTIINCMSDAKNVSKTTLVLLTLNLIFSCAQVPHQRGPKAPGVPIEDLVSQKARRSSVCIMTWKGTKIGYGSGFFVGTDLIATNIHVVAYPGPIFAKSFDSQTIWSVEGVTGYDVKNDLVVLKITGEGVPLRFDDSNEVQRGTPIVAVGNLGGKYKVMQGTIAIRKKIYNWIRITVKMPLGSSGGPVLNTEGYVIGCIVGYSDDNFHSYAIPANALKTLLAKSDPYESLSSWQKRDVIRAYAHQIQGQQEYRTNQYKDALAHFDKAIQLNPGIADFYYNRGNANYKLAKSQETQGNGRRARLLYQAAVEDYTQTIEKNPWYVRAYRNRGLTKAALGQKDGARRDLEEASVRRLESQVVP